MLAAPVVGAVVSENARRSRAEEIEKMNAAAKASNPEPVSAPAATLEDPSIQETEAQKLKRLTTLRAGVSRTVKTSGLGVQAPAQVDSPVVVGTKTKIGQ
jgi:hypothetical protein